MIYEKVSFVAWFGLCIDNDAKTAVIRRHDAKLVVITLVRLQDHSIGATRTHDLLQEIILADQGAPADHSKISVRRTDVITSVWLNSVGRAHPPLLQSTDSNMILWGWGECYVHIVLCIRKSQEKIYLVHSRDSDLEVVAQPHTTTHNHTKHNSQL